MSESVTSSEPTVAPAETTSAPPVPANPAAINSPAAPAFAFGTTRGSGLARGKRGGAAAAPATANTNTSAGEYKPTAIQVVTTEREYKNPFAPETPAAPVETTQAVGATATDLPPAPAPARVPAPTLAPVENHGTPSEQPASTTPVAETKPELKILPPEQRARPAQSWESGSTSPDAPAAERRPNVRREERGTFRPERREGSFEPRRDGREHREPRDRESREPREAREPREPRENRAFENRPVPTPPAPQKKGLLGWLKGVFGGKTEPEKPAAPETARGEGREEFGQRRRHHRGGRGRGGYRGENRGGENRGPREDGAPRDEGSGQFQGERRFEGGGHRRRRHRGGRGRGNFRGDNRGGEPRGDQGGSSPSA